MCPFSILAFLQPTTVDKEPRKFNGGVLFMSDKFLELFIEKTFYNELFNKLKSYIYLHRDEIKVRS